MRQFTLPLSFGLSVCLLAAGELPGARAQGNKQKSERARFTTVDQVELNGTFWPGSKGRKSPCVILLHKLGGKGSHEEGWDLLAEELAKKGFAVLSFDFRGHGASTSIGDDFWKYRFNRDLVKTFKPGASAKQPETINLADFKPGYAPVLVNDISAARSYLERKNDGGECNISNLILVGAEDGATLGALWLASESRRFRLLPGAVPARPRLNSKPEGKDVIACVWLSMSTTIGPDKAKTNVSGVLQNWLQDGGKTQKIPMAFLYGGGDTDSARLAQNWVQTLKSKGEPKETAPRPIDGAGKVRGSPLLKVKVEDGTVASVLVAENYLANTILDKYGSNDWEKRDTEKHPYVWAFVGRQIPAKSFDEKTFQPIPLFQFGFR